MLCGKLDVVSDKAQWFILKKMSNLSDNSELFSYRASDTLFPRYSHLVVTIQAVAIIVHNRKILKMQK